MKFRPSFHETLLTLWDESDHKCHGRDGKYGDVFTAVGVKVRSVVAFGRFGKHPNDDAVKAREFRHGIIPGRRDFSLPPHPSELQLRGQVRFRVQLENASQKGRERIVLVTLKVRAGTLINVRKSIILLLRLCVAYGALSLAGCGDVRSLAEPLVYAKRGGMSPSTEFASIKLNVDTEINRELLGERPVGEPTWKAYWQSRYDLMRSNIRDGHTQSQQYIDYIHQQRTEYALPLYDDGKISFRGNPLQ